MAVVSAPKQYRWLTTIVCDVGDLFVYSVVFLTEPKLPRKGVRIDMDSLCIPPFLEDKTKTFHDVRRARTFCDVTLSRWVAARRFLSNLNLCKSFIGCSNLPPFHFRSARISVSLRRVGSFWQPELCSCQALGMPLGSRMSGKGLCRGGSLPSVHKSRLI